jgi:Methylamine utilisation protein MauE
MSMIGIGIRWFFVLLLAASAIGKLADMPGFYAVIKSYLLLPEALIPISAWALAIFELALAMWLATGKRMFVAAPIVIALHFVYLAWLMIALARGLDIPNCGCFGVYWARPLSWFTLLEDLVLLALATVMWRSLGQKHALT